MLEGTIVFADTANHAHVFALTVVVRRDEWQWYNIFPMIHP